MNAETGHPPNPVHTAPTTRSTDGAWVPRFKDGIGSRFARLCFGPWLRRTLNQSSVWIAEPSQAPVGLLATTGWWPALRLLALSVR